MSAFVENFLIGASLRLQTASKTFGDVLDHPGELGTAREDVLRDALREGLPQRYVLGRGVVMGADNIQSTQQDILMYDGANYPVFSYVSGKMLVPESLFGSISVKSELRKSDLATYASLAKGLKVLVVEGCPERGVPLHGVVGYRTNGSWQSLLDAYVTHVEATEAGRSLDFLCDLQGHMCFDASMFGNVERLPASLRGRCHVMGMTYRACAVEVGDSAFADLYRFLSSALPLVMLGAATHTVGGTVSSGLTQSTGTGEPYHASFSGRSLDPWISPGQLAQLSAIYFNDGSETWLPGEVFLSLAEPPDPEGWRGQRNWASGWFSDMHYATCAAPVAPGVNGFYIYNVAVPEGTKPGEYHFYARLTRHGKVLNDLKWAHTVHVVAPPGG